jgi:hypothetical protein
MVRQAPGCKLNPKHIYSLLENTDFQENPQNPISHSDLFDLYLEFAVGGKCG